MLYSPGRSPRTLSKFAPFFVAGGYHFDVVVHQYNRHVVGSRDSVKERRFSKDPELRERHANTIREDIRKGS